MSSADIDSDLIPADEWYDPYLRFALYLGGAFQLVCILAVLFLPSEGGHRNTSNEEGDDFDSEVNLSKPLILVTGRAHCSNEALKQQSPKSLDGAWNQGAI